MRRFFGKLANGIRQSNKARAAKRGERRTSLGVEGLEERQLLSGFATQLTISTRPILPPGPIAWEYASLGGAGGVLGQPTSGVISDSGSLYESYQYQFYQHGTIFYSAATGAHAIYGAISDEYWATFGEKTSDGVIIRKALALPTNDETDVPGVAGAREQTFQGGTIYWSPTSNGAHVIVYSPIGAKYASLGGPAGYGLPISDEADLPGVPGVRFVNFQNGGSLYWSVTAGPTGAHAVYGAINAEYQRTAYETDYYGRDVQALLGAPTSDEMNVPGVPGARLNTFVGGTIYWSPGTGAHVVYGAIAAEYAATVNERGGTGVVVKALLGLPTSDEMNVPGVPGARMNTFQGGAIFWSPGTGAHTVYGAIGSYYLSHNGPAEIGLPTSEEGNSPLGDGRAQTFQRGTLFFHTDGRGVTGLV
jgi:uncharacterized protein with LGFP repeats